MNRKGSLAAQALLVLTAFAGAGRAADKEEGVEDESFDRTPVDCVLTNRIRRTKVLDDQTVLFELNGGVYLSNMLDGACPGLAREGRFLHETQGRLCDIDTITVLEQWGSSLRAGFTCRLGLFHPITELEAEELLAGPAEAAVRSPEVEEVEVPPDEAAPAPATEAAEAAEPK